MPSRTRVFGAVCILLMFVSACSSAETAPHDPILPQDLAGLEGYIRSEMENGDVPGLAIVITQADQIIWSKGFGYADLELGSPLTPDTPMRVGSISKPVLALAIMGLVEQGRVGLDQELTDVLPFVQLENQFAEAHPVLVRHLLSHTSGIDDTQMPELTAVYAGEDECELPLIQVLAVELPAVQTEPGLSYSYSGLGYGLLGAILEQITEQPFEDVVQTTVLEPLGMANSGFRLTAQLEEDLAIGHIKTAEGIQPVEYRCGYLRAGGNLHSSARDLARLLILFAMDGTLEGRQFLAPETLAAMQNPEVRLETLEYGLGVMTIMLPEGQKVIGHAGGVEGFNSHAWLEPESDIGVVVLVNCSAVACVQANEHVRNAAFHVMLNSTPGE